MGTLDQEGHLSIPRTRYTRAIEVGIFEDKIGVILTFDEGREAFLYDPVVAQDLVLKLQQVIDVWRVMHDVAPPPPEPPRALGISVGEDISARERIG